MPQDKSSTGGSRRGRLEDTAKPGAMKKILDEMDAEAKQARRSKSKGGGEERDRDRHDKERDRDKERSRDDKDRRDRDKDRESRHRDDKDRESKHKDDKDRVRRHQDDKDRDRNKDDKDRDRHRDEKDRERRRDDKDRDRHRDDKDRDRNRDDKDKDRERRKEDKDRDRHRDDKDRDRNRDDKDRDRHRVDKDRDRHRDDKDRDRHRDDKDRERHRDDKDRDRNRDDKDRDRHRDDKDRDRHRDDKDGERRRDDKDRDRHRDDKDRDRNRDDKDRDKRDRLRDKEDKDRKSSDKPTKSNGKAAAEAPEDDYNYDDDEFENYDEDFDDFEDENGDGEDANEDDERQQLKQPAKSNKEPPKKSRYDKDSHDDDDVDDDNQKSSTQQTPRPKAFIDFFGAKRRQANTAAASRTQRRWDELSRLIDLDKVSYDLFQLAPLEEYALYMRQYGRSNANQAAVQTNEDAIDREAMTEDIELANRWTQNPPGDLVECAGVDTVGDVGDDDEAADDRVDAGRRKKRSKTRDAQSASVSTVTSQPSATSLLRTLDLVRRVLEEQSRPRVPNGRREAAGHLSSGFTPLSPGSNYGPASRALFDPKRSARLLTMHPISSTLLIWSVHEPEQPLCALSAPGPLSSACWTPDGFVCAGLDDGALCLWDLAESAESHGRYDDSGVSLRGPTYSTAWTPTGNHLAGAVIALAPVGRALHTGGAYQLMSLDAGGRLQAWVASSHVGPADPAGSASDLGLRPGGRVSLMRSTKFDLPLAAAPLPPLCMSTGAKGDGAIIGGADGCLLHVTVGGGGGGGNRRYHSIGGDIHRRLPSSVTALDASPHDNGLLLIGYADGHIRLLTMSSANSLLTLQPKPDSIVRLLWSRSRPAVFFSLDSSDRLLVYDLIQKVTGPVSVFAESGVVDFAMGEDYHSTGRGSRSDRAVCALVRAGTGEVEVHSLAEALSNPELDEGFRLSQLIDRLCA